MFTRLRHGFTPTLLIGLATCTILFGGSVLVSEASPLLQTAPSLGTASSFAVLGASTVTNTGATVVNADLGLSPGTAVTGFPPGTVVGGTIHAADAVAAQAQSDTTTAYNNLAGQPCPALNNLTGQDLGGKTLTPGVYCYSSTAQLTGALTLNALGNASSVFIFQIGKMLTTATNSSVVMINPGSQCNVFWQIGSSATLGTTTKFMGSILALTSITLTTGATVNGRALAQTGAVTMDSNTIGTSTCVVGLPTATPFSPPPTQRPAPTAVFAPTAAAAPATAIAATATATSAATAASAATATSAAIPLAAATTTANTAPTATATAATSAAATQSAVTVAGAAASTSATGTAMAIAANAAAAPAAVVVAATVSPMTSTPASATPTPPVGLAGRAGGLDPLAIAGGLGLLGALAIGGGLVRRRRRSG